MLELQARTSDVVGCYARPDVLDELTIDDGASVRVAPDELLLLGQRDRLDELKAELAGRDRCSAVVDLSGGFTAWALCGDDRLEAFCRLSAIALPPAPALVQGLVAHVPAKVLVRDGEFLILVPSVLSHHLRERVLRACADLILSETAEAEPLLDEGALV